MAQEILDQTLEIRQDSTLPSTLDGDGVRSPPDSGEPALHRALSSSLLNARAAEFIPRSTQLPSSSAVPIRHGHAPATHSMMHVFHQAPPSPTFFGPGPSSFEYYAGGPAGGFGESEGGHAVVDPGPSPMDRDALSEEVIQKITKQVEYYFSDANLATTEHLMRFISKDPEGFVPISVVAAFKKIKALVHNNSHLAMALRTSLKLVVSDDGKRVRRQQPFTESDMEELQSRIVVAENLPEDHCYQNLMKIFSAVGRVKSIRTCYPQPANGTTAASRPTKLEMLFGNRLHAFVEYETVEDAEKAVSELNDEKNWRSGLRVKIFPKSLTKHGQSRGRKGHEGDLYGEEDVSTSNQSNDKQVEDAYHPSELSHEQENEEIFNDRDGVHRRGRGRGRGGRGRGRSQHHNNNRGGGHTVGTPPSSHLMHPEREQLGTNKLPPGPRMPDGTRGFTMGRGKPVATTSTA
ncbi:la-related protein 6B [Canna indica]|uniref:La-related protein 6B n=1 Tax=Canna indica TaxID=4628 RepID=A0AAQ3QHF2_9LILI|nr:la-related protein 6B [Canna indica]